MRSIMRFRRLICFLLLGLCFAVAGLGSAAVLEVPATTWAYDAQPRPNTAYDEASLSASGYDSASVLVVHEKQNAATGNRVLLVKIGEFLAAESGATFGRAASTDYRATFLAANPELEGQVVVHHAVEQQTLTRFPGVVSEAEIHSLENLRGIPKAINSDVHLSQIRVEWNQFYRANPNPSQAQLL